MVKIIETEYGIASKSGDTISVNKRLKKHQELREAIIDHEMNHSFEYNFDDLTMEFGISQLDGFRWRYYKFILSNPSTWTEYSPICIQDNQIKLSPTMFFFWLSTTLFFWLIFKLI